MSNEVRIRTLTADDLEAVIALAAALETAPHWPRAAYEAALGPSSAPPRIALVAELKGEMIGFAIASVIPPQAELETIAVCAARQRRKAGSALLSAVSGELESRRVTEITLEVRSSNLPAREFYRARGFVESGARPGYYPDTGEAAILMRAAIPFSEKRI